jgi:hypothetical protein
MSEMLFMKNDDVYSIKNKICECWLHKLLERKGLYTQPSMRFYKVTSMTSTERDR